MLQMSQAWHLSRRQVLRSAGAGFGYLALAGLLGQNAVHANAPQRGPLAPREPHFRARAKRIAAWVSNEQTGKPLRVVHGVVSTGAAWKFLRLQADVVTMDTAEYFIDNLPKIMGILRSIVETT